MHTDLLNSAAEILARSTRVLLVAGKRPDGDSIGTMLGLGGYLQAMGKQVDYVCAEEVPGQLKFIAGSEHIGTSLPQARSLRLQLPEGAWVEADGTTGKSIIHITSEDGLQSLRTLLAQQAGGGWNVIITVDMSTLSMLGALREPLAPLMEQVPVLQLDHHQTNDYYGRPALVSTAASSTAEIAVELLEYMEAGLPRLTPALATALLTGIVADTGSFQHANTTARALDTAAMLVERGADQTLVVKELYKTKQVGMLRVWGRVLANIHTDNAFRMVWSSISQEELAEAGGNARDAEGVIDELMLGAPGVELVALLVEQSTGEVKVSLRSLSPEIDTRAITEQNGGGGHAAASGMRLRGRSLADTTHYVVHALRSLQAQRLQLQPLLAATQQVQRLPDADDDVTAAVSAVPARNGGEVAALEVGPQ